MDGVSLWLVLLSTLMVVLTLLSPQATGFVRYRDCGFVAAMLTLEAGMIGAFVALDMFTFYVFWELTWCRCISSSVYGAASGVSTRR